MAKKPTYEELEQKVKDLEKESVERKQAEEALRESEERYRTAIEHSNDGVVMVKGDQRIFVNQKYLDIFGYEDTKEIIGKPLSHNLHPDESKKVTEFALRRQKGESAPSKYELKGIRKDGETIHLEVSVTRTIYRGETVALAYLRDISERKRAEEALRDIEEFNSSLLENSPIPILVVNEDTSIKYVNPALEKLTGYTSAEIIGRKAPYPWWTENQKPEKLRVRRNSIFKGVSRLERLHRKKNGDDFWIELTVTPIIRDGEYKYTLTTWVDITDRKIAEEALRESEEKYRAIFENAGDSIVLIDTETGVPVEFNEMAYKTLGYTSSEFKELKLSDIDVDRPHEEILENLKKRAHQGVFKLDSKHKTMDGRIRDVQITGKAVKIRGKNFILAIWNDITERKQAETQIKTSLKEKEVLLSEIHHRVKNNMQVITSLLRLQAANVKEKKYESMLKESQSRIRSMALVHETLYQSKDFSNVDFSRYLKPLINNLFRSYGIDTNKIKAKIEAEDVSIPIDSAVPCGLLVNELVSNALKYAFPDDRAGEILVALCSINEDELELIVSDNGIGMPEGPATKNTESFGMQLISILAEDQLDGKMELDRTAGTKYQIRFKREMYRSRI